MVQATILFTTILFYSFGVTATLLTQAVLANNLFLAKSLIKLKADVNQPDENRNTPLGYAVQKQNKKIYELLIEYGANVLLTEAVDMNDLPLAKSLIEGNADVNQLDKYQLTSLYYAVQNQNFEMVELLIHNGANVNQPEKSGGIPLHFAARKKDLNIVQLLIDKGSDLDWANRRGRTPIYEAVLYNNLGSAKLLVDAGANINLADHEGRTLLHEAIKNSNPEMVQIFTNLGVDVNKVDANGRTPLREAFRNPNPELVQLLINLGVDINLVDSNGRTPLHHAVIEGKTDMVRILLEAGADRNIRDKYGKTPKDLVFSERKELVRLFRSNVLAKFKKLSPQKDKQCPICVQDYDSDNNCPFVLPCNVMQDGKVSGHVICKECVKQINEKSTDPACAFCRGSFSQEYLDKDNINPIYE